MQKDKIEITYGTKNLERKLGDCCPFSDYRVNKDWLKPNEKLGDQYCYYPLLDDDIKIVCRYGLSKIKVPQDCPLREGELVKKIKLILGED